MKQEYIKAEVEDVVVTNAVGYFFEEYIEKNSTDEIAPDTEGIFPMD